MVIRIKNWAKFQHFKDRKPPWVKLYRDLLDDIEWHKLDGKAAKLLVSLWLIASEFDGALPDTETLAFRLRLSEKDVLDAISKLSHWLEHDDINAISTRYQVAPVAEVSDHQETETETEKENIHPGFARFWLVWPKSDRKEAKGKCLQVWVKAKAEPHADRIVAHVERLKASPGWKKDFGAFIPAPLTYLNQRKWEGVDEPSSAWWAAAGFADQFEAENAGCRSSNAHAFNGGKRIEVTA